MKQSIYFFVLITVIITGCQFTHHDDIDMTNFEGFKVTLPVGIDNNVLHMDLNDLQNLYYQSLSSFGKEISNDNIDITLEELALITDNILQKYPDPTDLSETNIDRILNDFSELNENNINEYIDVIDSFYTKIIRYELADTLAKTQISLSKSASGYGSNISFAEIWTLIWHPRLIIPTRDAVNQANILTSDEEWGKFPGIRSYKNIVDAYKHAIWNVLIAKYVGDKKNSIEKCVNWAKKFTDKHEEGQKKPQAMSLADFNLECEMDYHNNKIGRDYFSNVAWTEKQGTKTIVMAPSDNSIADAIYEKTSFAIKVATASIITNYPNNLVYIDDLEEDNDDGWE